MDSLQPFSNTAPGVQETALVAMIRAKFETLSSQSHVRNVTKGVRKMLEDRTTFIYFTILVAIVLLGVVGPFIAPYEATETVRDDQGQIKAVESPSVSHPLGTTFAGYDVLSQVLIGARPTVLTGLLGGSIIITIGMAIGITAGYFGGRTESILMRFTDLAYGVPLLPTLIVLVAFFGIGFYSTVFFIGILLWRSSARVLRSQVLQIKEYPFIRAAEATGASRTRIIFKHIIPNVAPMAVLFFAMGVGYSILLQAGLAFLGITDPFVPSWGVMVRNAFESGYMSTAWWWSVTPGLLIAITVLSTFMFGRGYESISGGGDESTDIALTG